MEIGENLTVTELFLFAAKLLFASRLIVGAEGISYGKMFSFSFFFFFATL